MNNYAHFETVRPFLEMYRFASFPAGTRSWKPYSGVQFGGHLYRFPQGMGPKPHNRPSFVGKTFPPPSPMASPRVFFGVSPKLTLAKREKRHFTLALWHSLWSAKGPGLGCSGSGPALPKAKGELKNRGLLAPLERRTGDMSSKFEPEPYWHIHHDTLLEWTTEPIENRIKFIETEKPKDERPLRLKLLRKMKGELPVAANKARRVYDKAGRVFDDKARRVYNKAGRVYNEARRAYDEAWRAYDEALSTHEAEINALHAAECEPDCPWNGQTIFPKEPLKK